ncbi:MAG TPA: trypsin-like peptidase domain-containing protein [Vicinamibacterales bacterium]|nr:trypsin-like peptidase domain-containing protein [Vicinamibacterales bacterium]
MVSLSDQMADAVERIAPSVVQVQGRRRPISGLAFDRDVVVTTARALGRDEHVSVRAHDGRAFEGELAGWDPATHLVVLRVAGLDATPAVAAVALPRVGNLALAVARSWSNAVTASAGIVSIIGGPLRTGRRHAIDQIIRTTAPMHEGFAGGAFVDTSGAVLGLTTAAAIRGLGVVIPSSIVWTSVEAVLKGGGKRGFLGLGGQTVELQSQYRAQGREQALLVSAVTQGGPADSAGVLVGDLLLDFDGRPVTTADDLLGLLPGDRIGQDVQMRILRGGAEHALTVRIGERPVG